MTLVLETILSTRQDSDKSNREISLKINWFLLDSGRLQKQPTITGWPTTKIDQIGESWFDVEEATPEELRSFLEHLDLHPVIMKRCLDSTNSPGVISHNRAVLLEFPSALNWDSLDPSYLTIILQDSELVTIRAGQLPALTDFLDEIAAEKIPSLNHLIQIVYLILDDLTDLSVQAEIEVRDKTQSFAQTLDDNPEHVNSHDLTNLRWQVDRLTSLIENQLYCATGLNSSDNEALQEPHRKAYLQDLLSELEIAQNGVHRLEARVNMLFDSYQAVGSTRVEKRLRILTIVSAVTLPFSLIAGLLGMNVGGLPATQDPQGFIIVIAMMSVIGAVELLYFRWRGWLD
jgi:Mg2+ and Co2+ transporter CorA